MTRLKVIRPSEIGDDISYDLHFAGPRQFGKWLDLYLSFKLAEGWTWNRFKGTTPRTGELILENDGQKIFLIWRDDYQPTAP